VKETMNDYRYFPEPDLAPIVISDEDLRLAKEKMPMLPYELFKKLSTEMGLLEEHAFTITEDKAFVDYFLEACDYTKNYKAVSNWLVSNIKGYLNENNLLLENFSVKPKKLVELINSIDSGEISNTAAQTLMTLLIASPDGNILDLATSNNLIQQKNTGALGEWADEVIAQNAQKVAEFKKGKKGLMGFFVGEVMKKSKGSADPKMVNEILTEKLN
jgi:aspartyl-tRNA(Asn)/glutamyl-tRNA(Gln) amidotransferase subunit B